MPLFLDKLDERAADSFGHSFGARFNDVTLRVQIPQNRKASGKVTAASNKSPVKRHYSKLLFAALALIPVALLAQNLVPTPRYSDQGELSKVEEWVLSQGTEESIAPELAAILGLGSDRLPVKLKSFLTTDGINLAFAVSTNPKQEGIVISALKTMTDKMEIYSIGTDIALKSYRQLTGGATNCAYSDA